MILLLLAALLLLNVGCINQVRPVTAERMPLAAEDTAPLAASQTIQVSLEPVASGFSQPLGIVYSGLPDDDRLFIVEKGGLIRILHSDGASTPFLNISHLVSSGSEQGLLGLTFHPDYAGNGYFYVNYTDGEGDSQIVRYSVSQSDAHLADPNSALVILTVVQPLGNHNGGDLKFGPDGYLYIGLGDGGGSGDPDNYSQRMGELLGKMLRLDVDLTDGSLSPDCGSGDNYSIPPDNPFVDGFAATCNEIWAAGLRNPWRFSFDRLSGDLYIADVGQNAWEEVNRQPAASPGGENYGWRCYEANAEFNTSGCDSPESYIFPIHAYGHGQGDRSITGGFVYRGSDYPALWGHYLFADYRSGRFWALRPDGAGGWLVIPLGQLLGNFSVSSFGEDVNGELYVSHLGNGTIYRVQENSPELPWRIYLPLIQKQ